MDADGRVVSDQIYAYGRRMQISLEEGSTPAVNLIYIVYPQVLRDLSEKQYVAPSFICEDVSEWKTFLNETPSLKITVWVASPPHDFSAREHDVISLAEQ